MLHGQLKECFQYLIKTLQIVWTSVEYSLLYILFVQSDAKEIIIFIHGKNPNSWLLG
jgi:hypothetical protein